MIVYFVEERLDVGGMLGLHLVELGLAIIYIYIYIYTHV